MYTAFKRSDMAYNYKWTAASDHDNPKIISGTDHYQLNREEGYEMLYFIRSLAKSWNWSADHLESAKKLEIIIKEKVPTNIRTHSGIKAWIEANYKQI